MGVEFRYDGDAEVQLVSDGGHVQTMLPAAPTATSSRAGKLLIVGLATAITLGWIAFLCMAIANFIGSLF